MPTGSMDLHTSRETDVEVGEQHGRRHMLLCVAYDYCWRSDQNAPWAEKPFLPPFSDEYCIFPRVGGSAQQYGQVHIPHAHMLRDREWFSPA